MLRILASLLMILFLLGCSEGPSIGDVQELTPFTWEVLDGGDFSIRDFANNRASVLITMDPECPMCANYSKTINDLVPKYSADSIAFYGLFTSEFYSRAEIRGFGLKYGVEIPFVLDPNYELASFLGARVTPEVFVFDRAGKLLYQGLIDDWAIALGKKKKKAENHYLANALEQIKTGGSPEPAYTKAVGCIIEYELE